jgi:superfamily I DNA/RNA helicase
LWPEPPNWKQLSPLEKKEVTALVKKNLEELGTTPAELAAWYALGNAAGNTCGLPELHPMQKEECVHTFHKLQARLLARPGLRAAGRENRTPDSNTIPKTLVLRESLTALGMTNKEIEAWESLARAANHIHQLPEVYPEEHRESQQDCHDIELRLLARPALRAVLDE